MSSIFEQLPELKNDFMPNTETKEQQKQRLKNKESFVITEFLNFYSKESIKKQNKNIKEYTLFLDTNDLVWEPNVLKWDIRRNIDEQKQTIYIPPNINKILGMKMGVTRFLQYSTILGYTDYASSAYWTFLIKEFQQDAFVNNKWRFHFIQEAQVDNTLDDTHDNANNVTFETSTKNYNNGKYWFNSPIVVPDSLTLKMGQPFEEANIVQQTTRMRVFFFAGSGSSYIFFYWDDEAPRPNGYEFTISYADSVTVNGYTNGDPVTYADLIYDINTLTHSATYVNRSVSGVLRYGIELRNYNNIGIPDVGYPLYVLVKVLRYRQIIPLTIYYDANNYE